VFIKNSRHHKATYNKATAIAAAAMYTIWAILLTAADSMSTAGIKEGVFTVGSPLGV
jgi:hypothetical protein